jgi:hypothetical protein
MNLVICREYGLDFCYGIDIVDYAIQDISIGGGSGLCGCFLDMSDSYHPQNPKHRRPRGDM